MNELSLPEGSSARSLRRGWTTGACASAATAAAYEALLSGCFPDPVTVRLPRGETPSFRLAEKSLDVASGTARAAIVKDAGDDPDVTHLALVASRVRRGSSGSGTVFLAGEGVGTVTMAGLPIPPGEPAINPAPRAMMTEIVAAVSRRFGASSDVEIEISIPGGAALAEKTWNPRLGVRGGLSILGTTGIVKPFSCSAWIDAIRKGIDVARADGLDLVAAATGRVSESSARREFSLPSHGVIDMGDFLGGMMKHLRRHPIPRLVFAGGFGKTIKAAQGASDLHSGRSRIDFERLARRARDVGLSDEEATAIASSRSALEAASGLSPWSLSRLASALAEDAASAIRRLARDAPVAVGALTVSRDGEILARVEPSISSE